VVVDTIGTVILAIALGQAVLLLALYRYVAGKLEDVSAGSAVPWFRRSYLAGTCALTGGLVLLVVDLWTFAAGIGPGSGLERRLSTLPLRSVGSVTLLRGYVLVVLAVLLVGWKTRRPPRWRR
jgi:hypothetical protein